MIALSQCRWVAPCASMSLDVGKQTLTTAVAHDRLLQLPCRDKEIHAKVPFGGERGSALHRCFAVACTSGSCWSIYDPDRSEYVW